MKDIVADTVMIRNGLTNIGSNLFWAAHKARGTQDQRSSLQHVQDQLDALAFKTKTLRESLH